MNTEMSEAAVDYLEYLLRIQRTDRRPLKELHKLGMSRNMLTYYDVADEEITDEMLDAYEREHC